MTLEKDDQNSMGFFRDYVFYRHKQLHLLTLMWDGESNISLTLWELLTQAQDSSVKG